MELSPEDAVLHVEIYAYVYTVGKSSVFLTNKNALLQTVFFGNFAHWEEGFVIKFVCKVFCNVAAIVLVSNY